MCVCMFRRGFLKAAAVSPALLACQAPAAEPSRLPLMPTKWIDVHCHVFNGRDLPIYEFIKKTRFSHANPSDWVAAAAVAFLAGGLQRKAPSVADEIALLQSSRAVAAVPADADPVAGCMRLRARAMGAADGSGASSGEPPAPQEGEQAAASDEMFGAPRDAMALMMLDKALRDTRIRAPAPIGAGPPPMPSDRELEQFGALIQANREPVGSVRGPGPAASASKDGAHARMGMVVGRFFDWGMMFASTRNALVSNLASLYPANATLMLTPAIVDYDAWLGAHDTHPANQLRVMEHIAIIRAREGMPVHTFAAFDPWRCLRMRSVGVDTLAHLATALAAGSAVGVKLYPPMGFAAAGNADRDISKYPFPADLVRLTKGRPGLELDAVLDELFDYCAADGIPVMAHCGPSNAIAPDYADLAAPSYWRKALSKSRPHRGELRLNLGHFGGIWDLGPAEPAQRAWAEEISDLMMDYPNVYADIGYFGAVLHPEQSDVRDATVAFIADQANKPNSVLRNRLMYGSDWSMIGLEPFSRSYALRAVEALSPIWPGEQQEYLTWRNAATFLGLGPNDQTRRRLLDFYAAKRIDAAPLLAFDPTLS